MLFLDWHILRDLRTFFDTTNIYSTTDDRLTTLITRLTTIEEDTKILKRNPEAYTGVFQIREGTCFYKCAIRIHKYRT